MYGRILVVDDAPEGCGVLGAMLRAEGTHLVTTSSAAEALARLGQEAFDVVFTDVAAEGGLELCAQVCSIDPDLPIVVVRPGSMGGAIAAMRAGAYDFLTKPVDQALLGISVARALQHRRVYADVKRLRAVTIPTPALGEIIGSGAAIQRVRDNIARISGSDASVSIRGETGVGKELIAHSIHASSALHAGPFVALNCAAVPAALLESELFGHERGAFTDAKVERTGLFVRADHGTLFLDEVGDLPLELQPKLLRALQERRVRPVGANTEIPFKARLLTATNRNLEVEVKEKRFREDLYYRINVVQIDIPPLRERDGDVLELAQYFLQNACRGGGTTPGLSPEVAEKLIAYHWPGNVRELENCIARAVAFARYDELTVEDLPEKVRAYRVDRFVAVNKAMEVVPLAELEKRYVQRVLAHLNGNKTLVAQVLGIDRRTLHRMVDKWGEEAAVDSGVRSVAPAVEGDLPVRRDAS
jgi:DNA-binding NtrC family response regulator